MNIDQVKEYCEEAAEFIECGIDQADKEGWKWNISIVTEGKYFITIAFYTKSFSSIYEISKRRKVLTDRYTISHVDCETILGYMQEINKQKTEV